MSDDEEMEFKTVTLTDDDGTETEFVILDETEDNGRKYILAIESEDIDNENAEAVIFRKANDCGDDEDVYELIEDDGEFDRIAALFQLSSDDYDVEIDD